MKNRNAAIGFIFITILLDVIGFGIIIPVLPGLIMNLTGTNNSAASEIGGNLITVYSIMQFIFSPIVGSLSDRYGRRPILLLSLIGFGIDYLIIGFAPTMFWLFTARIISGIMGASVTTATAYIADISNDANRAKNFGMIGAAFGMGFIIGPLIGGFLGHFNIKLPFFIAAGLSLINAAYGYFILPESLGVEARRKFEWKRANPIGAFYNLFKYKKLLPLSIAFLLLYVASHAVQTNWIYFTTEKFHWSELENGISLAVVGLIVGIIQGGLIRYINPKLGNERSVYIGFIFYAIGMILFAMASNSIMMYCFIIPYCLGGISGPALQSIITAQVPKNEQGELQGSLTALMSLANIIGPLMMTRFFRYFTKNKATLYIPGAPFLLGASLIIISSAIAYFTLRVRKATTL